MSNQLRIAARRAFARAPGVIAHYPCFQAWPDVALIDRSGAGNNATFGANLLATPAWANANRLTVAESVTGTNAGAPYLTGAQVGWNLATESVLVSGIVNVTSSVNHGAVTGNGSSNSIRGFTLRVTQNDDGTVANRDKLVVVAYGASTLFGTHSAATVGGAGDIHVAMAIDATSQRAYVFVGGAYDATANGGPSYVPGGGGLDFSAQRDSMAAACLTNPWMFGAQPHTGLFALSAGCQSYGWQIAKRTGGLPSNIEAVVRRLARHPLQVLTSTEWPA